MFGECVDSSVVDSEMCKVWQGVQRSVIVMRVWAGSYISGNASLVSNIGINEQHL